MSLVWIEDIIKKEIPGVQLTLKRLGNTQYQFGRFYCVGYSDNRANSAQVQMILPAGAELDKMLYFVS